MSMDLVTVFRSGDSNAEGQAVEVCELLADSGIEARVFPPSEPGVAMGTFEVRVPPERAQEAESLIASHREQVELPVDASHDLDMALVFRSDAHNAEMLAAAIHSLMQANGIPSLIVGAAGFPSLPFEVRVPRARLEEAQRAIRAAEEAGPAAAEEAARASEGDLGGF